MNKTHNVLEQHKKRLNSEITREEYWSKFKDFLGAYSGFIQLQNSFGNTVTIVKDEMIVNLKCTETHETRISMKLDPNDVRSVPFSVLADGYYEPYQSDLLVSLGKISAHFLDVGSNMGFYSLALASENLSLKVDAFEPQPLVFSMLQGNVELNQLRERVRIHNVGLGKDVGILKMYVPKFTGSGGASFQNLHEDEGEATEIEVGVAVLDQTISTTIDLIKIDVEGFELNVLQGAESLISEMKPTVVVELLRKWMKPFGHTPQMFLEEMSKNGYLCFAIGERELVPTVEIDESTSQTNFIFVHPERLAHIDLIKGESKTR